MPEPLATPPLNRAQLDQLQRESLFAFLMVYFQHVVPNRRYRRATHVEAMCVALERVFRGESRRMIITVPPRHLKSVTVAMAFAAWVLGHDPSKKILVASYGADLALDHARGFKAITEHPSFERLFPRFKINPARNTADEMVTTMHGGRKAISVGGAATGFGADLIIVDDLLKASDATSETVRTKANDFFDTTLYSRLNIKSEAAIVVIQQRLHEDDLVGHLLEQGRWEHINMPAIADRDESFPLTMGRTFERRKGDLLAPDLEGRAELDEARLRLGPTAFNAQYLLDPMPPEGNRLDWSWFKVYDEPLPRDDYSYVVQSWDTATSDEPTAAYSVCMTFGYDQGAWDLLDVVRERLIYPRLRARAQHLYRKWKPDRVIIEDASSGRALVQDMKEDLPEVGRRTIIPFTPIGDKETRFDIQTSKIEQGLIALPEAAPWLAAFRHELRRFPLSTYYDQVDALSQFLEWTGTSSGKALTLRDPLTGRLQSAPRPHGTDWSRLGGR